MRLDGLGGALAFYYILLSRVRSVRERVCEAQRDEKKALAHVKVSSPSHRSLPMLDVFLHKHKHRGWIGYLRVDKISPRFGRRSHTETSMWSKMEDYVFVRLVFDKFRADTYCFQFDTTDSNPLAHIFVLRRHEGGFLSDS